MRNILGPKPLFKIGQFVHADGVACTILEVDTYYDVDDHDYLLEPVDKSVKVMGQTELGAGWVLESTIDERNTLLAAAPELLEMLELTLDELVDGDERQHQLRVKIERLINKARGLK